MAFTQNEKTPKKTLGKCSDYARTNGWTTCGHVVALDVGM